MRNREKDMENELKPCPFCGEAPVFPKAAETFGSWYECGCESCGLASAGVQIIDCFDHPRDHVHASWNNETHQYGVEFIDVARNQAIAAWNARAELKPSAAPGLEVAQELISQWLAEQDDPDHTTTTAQKCRYIAEKAIAWDRQHRAAPVSVDAEFEGLLLDLCRALYRAGRVGDKDGPGLEGEALRTYVNTLRHPKPEADKTVADLQGDSSEPRRKALEKIIRTPTMPFLDAGAHSWEAFGRAAYAAWRDIQNTARAALNEMSGGGK
jgi:hypothetical protein